MHDDQIIGDAAVLPAMYRSPPDAAIANQVDYLHPLYRASIEA